MQSQIKLSRRALSSILVITAVIAVRPGHAGEWVSCALDPNTGEKAVVVGAHEISLEPDVPFEAMPMRMNPKLTLAPGHQSGRCYLNQQQQQAVLNR